MMLLSTRKGHKRLRNIWTTTIEVVKHKNKCKWCCKAQEQGQKRLRSIWTTTIEVVKLTNIVNWGWQTRFPPTRAKANEVHQHKVKGKEVVKHTNNTNWGCWGHKLGQTRFLSTRKNANEVHKHKIKGKRGCYVHEQRQLRLLSTQ